MYVSIPKKLFNTHNIEKINVRDVAMFMVLKHYSFKGSIHNYKSQYQNICKKYGFCESTLRKAIKRLYKKRFVGFDPKNPKNLIITGIKQMLLLETNTFKRRLQEIEFTSYKELIALLQYKSLAVKEEAMIYAEKPKSVDHNKNAVVVRGSTDSSLGISRRTIAKWLGYKSASSAMNIVRKGIAKGIVTKDEKRRFEIVEKNVPFDNIYRYNTTKEKQQRYAWMSNKNGDKKGCIVKFKANIVNFVIDKKWAHKIAQNLNKIN